MMLTAFWVSEGMNRDFPFACLPKWSSWADVEYRSLLFGPLLYKSFSSVFQLFRYVIKTGANHWGTVVCGSRSSLSCCRSVAAPTWVTTSLGDHRSTTKIQAGTSGSPATSIGARLCQTTLRTASMAEGGLPIHFCGVRKPSTASTALSAEHPRCAWITLPSSIQRTKYRRCCQ